MVSVRRLVGSDTSSSHPGNPPTTTISLTRQAWVGESQGTCFKSVLGASASQTSPRPWVTGLSMALGPFVLLCPSSPAPWVLQLETPPCLGPRLGPETRLPRPLLPAEGGRPRTPHGAPPPSHRL